MSGFASEGFAFEGLKLDRNPAGRNILASIKFAVAALNPISRHMETGTGAWWVPVFFLLLLASLWSPEAGGFLSCGFGFCVLAMWASRANQAVTVG